MSSGSPVLPQRIPDDVLARVNSYDALAFRRNVRSPRGVEDVRPLPPRETEPPMPPAVQS
jgi:hypothetical protein